MGSFFPHYTYVYYIQMPDVMNADDGVLYFLGENKKEYLTSFSVSIEPGSFVIGQYKELISDK